MNQHLLSALKLSFVAKTLQDCFDPIISTLCTTEIIGKLLHHQIFSA